MYTPHRVSTGLAAAAGLILPSVTAFVLRSRDNHCELQVASWVAVLMLLAFSAEMLEMYKGFIDHYGVITIEDPYEQDDWDNWKAITAEVKCQIVGDDQLVTNPTRIKKAIEEKAANALLLKVGLVVIAACAMTVIACDLVCFIFLAEYTIGV